VESSDVYLLLVGPHYGHVFEDTQQSATHDEWMAATAAGMSRLVYRKSGAKLDADQAAFVAGVEDYAAGVFRDSFGTTAELLTKVVAKIRELAESSGPLAFAPLAETPVVAMAPTVRAEWPGSAVLAVCARGPRTSGGVGSSIGAGSNRVGRCVGRTHPSQWSD
jgi:hypothetical protein